MDGLEQDRALLRALCTFSGMQPSKLAVEAGLAATTVLRPYNGTATTRLSAPTLQKLKDRFPDFDGWSAFFGQSALQADPDLVEIDQIDLRFGMGATYLDGPVESEKRVFSRSWLRNFTRAAPEQLFWTLGDGDSMEPTIRSGEVILIDRSQDTLRSADGIWAVTVGDIVQIKRLRPRANGAVEILSDNPSVPPDVAVDGELHVIGRVVAVVRRL